MFAEIVNLTPHAIKIGIPQDSDGDYVFEELPPSGVVARVSTSPSGVVGSCRIAVYGPPVFGRVEGLPEPKEGVIYLVSSMVAGRLVNRPDVMSPGTGPNDGARRDEKGQISWVTRFIRSC